jgi:hypothetical protein
MPTAILGNVAGAVVGGLLSDDGGGQSSTQNKEPWKEVQPWLKENITQGQQLQQQYQQNPFNSIQQQAYGNMFGDMDSFRNNIAPNMMQFANNAMSGGGYQRPQYSQPGAAGYAQRPPVTQQQPSLLQPSAQPMPSPAGGYGSLLQSAFQSAAKPPAPVVAPEAPLKEDEFKKMFESNMGRYYTMPQDYERFA